MIIPPELRCQHPRVVQYGYCNRESVIEMEIPADYTYEVRLGTGKQVELVRPVARLCRQHRGILEAWIAWRAGDRKRPINGHSHEAFCDVCRHPKREWVEQMFVNWRMTREDAVRELDISHKTWDRHVDKFMLDEKKMRRDKRKKFLLDAIEKGQRAGGHSIATALQAERQLSKAEGDNPPEQSNVNVLVANVDMSKLSNEELAAHMDRVAAQLRALEEQSKSQPALEAGEERTITLPKSAIRVREYDE